MADYKAKTNWLPDDPINEDDLNRWEAGIKAANEEGDEHRNNKQNPHGVTKAQLGLNQVENVRQASKADFDAHEKNKQNPHEVNKGQVGLGSVQNYPIASKAQAEAGNHTASYMTPQGTKQAIDIHNTLLNHISVLGLNALNFDVEPVDYPVGISYFYINSAEMKYPGQNVFITTFRDVDQSGQPRAFQTIQGIGSNYNQTWTRGSRNGTWGDLIESESKAGAQSKVNAHENKKTNPHGVTKEQVGLGSLTNDQQARKVDHDAHVANKQNPHNVTTEQINIIGPVAADRPGSDYPNGITMFQTANGESIGYPGNQIIVHTIRQGSHRCIQYIYDASSSTDRIWFRTWRLDSGWKGLSENETTEGAQLKVNAHENNKDNPHGVTKAQVGLSNVQNFPIATQVQAEAGNYTASLMTPERVRQFAKKYGPDFDAFNGLALDHGSHKNNKNNPHDVTSKQINIIDFKPAKDSASTYPEGVSLHFISTHSNNSEGYPYGFGTVQTNRVHNSRTFQIFTGNGDRDESMNSWTRWAFENTWTDWVQTETLEGAKEKANKAEANAKAASVSKTGDTMSGALTLNRGIVLGTTYADSVGALYRRTSEDDLRAKMARGWVSLETTEGAAAKVKAHSDQKNNPHNVTSEQINIIAVKRASELASTYPIGVSLFSISRSNNDVTGFPFGFGTIQTNRVHNSRTFQIFTGNGDTEESKNSWIRWAFENSWTDWQEYMSSDTGWVRLTLQNGVKLYGSDNGVYIRRVGKMVQMRGAVTNILSDSTHITTVPEQFRPTSGRSIIGNTSLGDGTAYFVRYHLSGHNGHFACSRNSRGQAGYVDGLWYPLDFTWMVDD